MGLFKKKQDSQERGAALGPHVGFTRVVASSDGAVYVNQQHDREMDPALVAAVIALTWGLWTIQAAKSAGGEAAARARLQLLTQVRDAEQLNDTVNPGGLISINPPSAVDPEGPSAHARVRLVGDDAVTAIWSELERFETDDDLALRGFAGLWTIADRHGAGQLVWRALRGLPADPIGNPPTLQEVLTQPMRLLIAAEQGDQEDETTGEAEQDWQPGLGDGRPVGNVAQDEAGREGIDDPRPTGDKRKPGSASEELQRAMIAVNELLTAGTISEADAADLRDRAMTRFEQTVTGGH